MRNIRYIGLIMMIVSCDAQWVMAQICQGSLGENIFLRGDFGSGTDPVLDTDPMIAPGYSYSTFCPGDGSYSICSRTGALPGLFNTWLDIADNSSDPNGYMMVVNASYSPGNFYEEEVDGLCENTLYEFSADIINIVRIGVPNHIQPNVDFLIDGVTVYSTGNIPQDEKWKKFGFSFVTNANQNTVILTLRNNAPGGGGNDLALDNISFRPCGPSSFIGIDTDTTIFLCVDDDPITIKADINGANGQSYAILWQWSADGMVWNTLTDSIRPTVTHIDFTPGDYYYRYFSAGNSDNILNEKCRTISESIKLTVLPDIYYESHTICEGLTYEFGPQSLDQSGIYTQDFMSSKGCDSTVVLDLSVEAAKAFILDYIVENPSCHGLSDGEIMILNVGGGHGEAVGTILDNDNEQSASMLPSGSYVIQLVDKIGCVSNITIELQDPEALKVEIDDGPINVRLGDKILVEAKLSNQDANVIWMGNGEADCDTCDAIDYLPYSSGYLYAQVADDNGCSAYDSLYISVEDSELIYLPNIFSPNGDGINDEVYLHFYGNSVAHVTDYEVYDRWGGLVYRISDVNATSGMLLWDGYSQYDLEDGVYVINMTLELINGNVINIVKDITIVK